MNKRDKRWGGRKDEEWEWGHMHSSRTESRHREEKRRKERRGGTRNGMAKMSHGEHRLCACGEERGTVSTGTKSSLLVSGMKIVCVRQRHRTKDTLGEQDIQSLSA
jgi:hypothetical protein